MSPGVLNENCQTKQAKTCLVCESVAKNVYKMVNNVRHYKCRKCRLLWVDGPNAEMSVSFYNKMYFNSDLKTGYANYLADELNHRRNARSIISIVEKEAQTIGPKILDVGCAFGFLLE